MRRIKTYKLFESCTEKEKLIYDDCVDSYYWKISTKYPNLEIALNKIGASIDQFKFLYDDNEHKFVYIFKTIYNNDIQYTFASLDFSNPSYRKPPKFMGRIVITDEDIEEWKLNNTLKKYNL